MRYVVAIPYTQVVFSTSKGCEREVCIDSFSLAYISDICRVSLLTYPCKSVRKYGLTAWDVSLGTKMLRREVPSHKVLDKVVDAYRRLSMEVLELRKRAMPKPAMSLLLLLAPWQTRASNEDLSRLSKLTISLSLLENVLGKEVLTESPIINSTTEFMLGLKAEVSGDSIRFLGDEPLIKVYNKLMEMDENLRTALIRELTR